MTQHTITICKKDFFLVSFIGVSFALFSLPILINLNIPFITITPLFIVSTMLFFAVFANIALAVAWKIGTRIPVAYQFAKFGAVGAFNTFLDWSILNVLMHAFSVSDGVLFSVFKGISFVCAAISAYFWNKYWTFGAKKQSDTQEVLTFALVSGTGFLLNVGIASAIVMVAPHTHIITPAQLANIAAAAATVISLVWNFVGYKLFVFKK